MSVGDGKYKVCKTGTRWGKLHLRHARGEPKTSLCGDPKVKRGTRTLCGALATRDMYYEITLFDSTLESSAACKRCKANREAVR